MHVHWFDTGLPMEQFSPLGTSAMAACSTAVAEMAFSASACIGAMLWDGDEWYKGLPREVAWFGESPGFVLEVADVSMEDFFVSAEEHGLYAAQLGRTTAEPSLSSGSNVSGSIEERISLTELREAWEAPLRDFYGSVA